MLSRVGYSRHLAMLVTMDAEWTRRIAERGEEISFSNHRRFREKCIAYGNGINANYVKWCRANRVAPNAYLNPTFYNPASYLPLSGGDDACLVIVDDHDASQHIALHGSSRMEDVGWGYGIDPTTLDLGARCDILTGLDGMLDPDLGPLLREGSNETVVTPGRGTVVHRFQRDMPLLAAVRFRMAGLSSVGHALACQHATFRAMAQEIGRARAGMRQAANAGRAGAVFCEGDVEHCRCVLLDIQRTEEIALLVFCRNFSVAAQIVFAMRSLRYADAFRAEPRLAETLGDRRRSPAHDYILRTGKRAPALGVGALRGRHLFRWSRSSLFVSPQAAFEDDLSNCNGRVRAWLGVQVAPGHEASTNRGIQRVIGPLVCGKPEKEVVHFAASGMHDILVEETRSTDGGDAPLGGGVRSASVIETKGMVRNLVRMRRSFCRAKGDSPEKPGRDLVEMTHLVSVPILGLVAERKKGRNSPGPSSMPLTDMLERVRQGLLGEGAHGPQRQDGEMTLVSMLAALRAAGLPLALRRNVASLFQKFVTVLADPFLFDLVLDLYDIFASLYNLLSRHLGRTEGGIRSGGGAGQLDGARVVQVSRLVTAIHSAMSHRLAKAWPESGECDMGIDFRGGLNQVLLAASAPMMCGLGLLRQSVCPGSGEGSSRRDTVGVVTCLSIAPGVRAQLMGVGRAGGPTLGYLEADVAHILHVADYADYVHEACHFIFSAIADLDCSEASRLALIADPVVRKHVCEVFALLLSHVVIFGGRDESAFCHYVASYSRCLASVGVDDVDTVVRFVHLALRVFFVHESVGRGRGRVGEGCRWDGALDPGVAFARFEDWIRKYGGYFTGYDRLFNGQDSKPVWEYTRAQFGRFYGDIAAQMPRVVREVARVFAAYRRRAVLPTGADGLPRKARFVRMVREALDSGRPIQRSYISTRRSRPGRPGEEGPWDPCVDALHVLCAHLRTYIGSIREADGRRVHVCRCGGLDGQVEFPDDGVGGSRVWHDFLIDRGRAALFCAVPEKRASRLRRQAIIIKTAWDISSALRARRLWLLMKRYG